MAKYDPQAAHLLVQARFEHNMTLQEVATWSKHTYDQVSDRIKRHVRGGDGSHCCKKFLPLLNRQ